MSDLRYCAENGSAGGNTCTCSFPSASFKMSNLLLTSQSQSGDCASPPAQRWGRLMRISFAPHYYSPEAQEGERQDIVSHPNEFFRTSDRKMCERTLKFMLNFLNVKTADHTSIYVINIKRFKSRGRTFSSICEKKPITCENVRFTLYQRVEVQAHTLTDHVPCFVSTCGNSSKHGHLHFIENEARHVWKRSLRCDFFVFTVTFFFPM